MDYSSSLSSDVLCAPKTHPHTVSITNSTPKTMAPPMMVPPRQCGGLAGHKSTLMSKSSIIWRCWSASLWLNNSTFSTLNSLSIVQRIWSGGFHMLMRAFSGEFLDNRFGSLWSLGQRCLGMGFWLPLGGQVRCQTFRWIEYLIVSHCVTRIWNHWPKWTSCNGSTWLFDFQWHGHGLDHSFQVKKRCS